MMKYPYIGEGVGSGSVVIMFKPKHGVVIDSKTWATDTGKIESKINEARFIDITHEYLQNTYGEVQSPEHAEFIVELCKNHGIAILNNPWESATHFTISNNQLFFVSCAGIESTELKQITIPLPPKADKQEVSEWKPDFSDLPKHFDCMCNKCGGKCCTGQCSKQDVSEWPQVGDEVALRYKFDSKQIMHTGKLLYLSDNHIIIATDKNSNYHCHRCDWSIEKPKTPEEELRDDIVWLTIKHMENKLHPIEANAYYLFSDLMGKYNITKKV